MALLDDTTFINLFNGCDEIYGKGKTYSLAMKWIKASTNKTVLLKRLVACLIFFEKPRKYLILGESKSGKTNKIADFLPHFDKQFDDDESGRAAMRARSHFPEEFKLVNFTAVRNVAMLALEYGFIHKIEISSHYVSWYKAFGVPPSLAASVLARIVDPKSETYTIRLSQFEAFASHRKHWEPLLVEFEDHLKK